MRDLHDLQKQLGYTFRDPAYLDAALTHTSYAFAHNCSGYERLEFLGDSVVGYYAARKLFERYPDADEGALTEMRKKLVSQSALAGVSRDQGYGAYLRKAGIRVEDKQLCDIFEALVGAICLDGGLAQAEAFLDRRIGAMTANARELPSKDYKTLVKEAHDDCGDKLEYDCKPADGQSQCRLMRGDRTLAQASGSSKKHAEQACAKALWEQETRDGRNATE